MSHTLFLEGPAGVGKTTYAIRYIRDQLDAGVPPESILILVPQRALGQPYTNAFVAPDWPGGAQIDVVTLGGLARRGVEVFWPLIAPKAGFAHPDREPVFLTIETSQYYMDRFVGPVIRQGVFDGVSVERYRIVSQILDNLSKAAVNRFPLDEVADRLVAAWGDRHSSRPPVYRASLEIARQFREHCLEYNLLDFSLQIELFTGHLLPEPLYRDYFSQRYRHLVADNLEEDYPVVGDFIRWWWDDLESALLIYDCDAGYRIFLGADPAGAQTLAALCDEKASWDQPLDALPAMVAFSDEISFRFEPGRQPPDNPGVNPCDAFNYEALRFYPQMVDWVAEGVAQLIERGTSPREMVVLAPFLGDSLRFMLTSQLSQRGIPVVSHRPSRAFREEPAARAMLTWMALAHPEWDYHPPVMDVADALQQTVGELDPVRAWLLAQIVYKPNRGELSPFDIIEQDARARITYVAGERYEHLRRWLSDNMAVAQHGGIPPDHFLSRLFGEVLSQPGYDFHTNLDAGRAVAELVESARKFRQTLYPNGAEDWDAVTAEFFSLIREGLLAALHVESWRDEQQDAVFIAPAYTFLMRNRRVDYQFWLDVGSSHWWERLEQPLTHPYVLARDYPLNMIWTDELEFTARNEALRRLLVGLTRRCRKHIYMAISSLSDSGYEQRGPLLQLIQQVVQRHAVPGEV